MEKIQLLLNSTELKILELWMLTAMLNLYFLIINKFNNLGINLIFCLFLEKVCEIKPIQSGARGYPILKCSELGTLEWWILRSMLFFLNLKTNLILYFYPEKCIKFNQ